MDEEKINEDEEILNDGVFRIKKDKNGNIISRILRSGTLQKFMDYLCFEMAEELHFDASFLVVFFATFKSFTTREIVLGMLKERYLEYLGKEDDKSKNILSNITNIVVYWLKKTTDIKFFYTFNVKDSEFMSLYSVMHEDHQNIIREKIRQQKEFMERYENKLTFTQYKINTEIGSVLNDDEEHRKRESTCSLSIMDFTAEDIAHSLTNQDAIYFKQLNISDCLGSIWGNRHKKNKIFFSTVTATVEYFNFISQLVITTILCNNNGIKSETCRAKVIEHWIKVVRYLRVLKNFSSLKAILSAFSTKQIYEIKNVWGKVSKNMIEELHEYAAILCEENNNKVFRDILKYEGSSRVSGTVAKRCKNTSSVESIPTAGTIPYLGTFLTDLINLDTAHSSYDLNGFINFDKKRKEFEVLARLILYKSSLSFYSLKNNPAFDIWANNFIKYENRNGAYAGAKDSDVTKSENITDWPERGSSYSLIENKQITTTEKILMTDSDRSCSDLSAVNEYLQDNNSHLFKYKSCFSLYLSDFAYVTILVDKIFTKVITIELNSNTTTECLIKQTLTINNISENTNVNYKLYQCTPDTCIHIIPKSKILLASKQIKYLKFLIIPLKNDIKKSTIVSKKIKKGLSEAFNEVLFQL